MTVSKPRPRYGWSGQEPAKSDPVDSNGLTVGSRCKHYTTGSEGVIRRAKRLSIDGGPIIWAVDFDGGPIIIWAVDFDDGLLDANQREGTVLPL